MDEELDHRASRVQIYKQMRKLRRQCKVQKEMILEVQSKISKLYLRRRRGTKMEINTWEVLGSEMEEEMEIELVTELEIREDLVEEYV